MSKTQRLGARSRRGVALLIVMGLLSLMMVMAVAFSVTMRVERAGAGNYAASVFSRNMAWAALSTAIEAIDTSMATSGTAVYPDWTLLPSTGNGQVRLGWGECLHHIPGGDVRTDVEQTLCAWHDAAESAGIIGRFAYLAINASGFVDANLAGGSNRLAGSDPSELDLGQLPDFASTNLFLQYRLQDKRYETLEELANMQQGYGFASNAPPTNLVVYSRFPQGWLDGTNTQTNVVYIGGDVAQLQANQSAIVQAIKDSFTGPDVGGGGDADACAAFVFTNLLDYVDADNVPRDLASACTEAVPMINEFAVTGRVVRVSASDTNCRVQAQMQVEVFYPFLKPSPKTYRLAYEVRTVVSNEVTGASASATVTDQPNVGYNANVDVHPWYHVLPAISLPVVLIEAAPGARLRVTFLVKAQVQTSSDWTAVDAVPWPATTNALALNPTWQQAIVAPDAGMRGFNDSLETWDPRFNWDTANAGNSHFWRRPLPADGGPSLGQENHWTKRVLLTDAVGHPEYGMDQDTSMCVSDKGRLVSVGELGHLLRGTRAADHKFRTLRLFNHYHPDNTLARELNDVLSRFTVRSNSVARGLVNLNGAREPVLKTVFSGMRMGYPENSNNVIQATEVTAITDAIIQNGPYRNLCDMGEVNWRTVLSGRKEAEREAAVAYSCGLLGTRQNLFIVLVAAGPFSRGLGQVASFHKLGDWLGSQRGVALVWRDPYPDPEGHFPAFVQYFKWLDD